MSKKIMLNCMPPALVGMPSPGLTVIKTHLERHGYVVDIVYWNIIFNTFQKDFFRFMNRVSEDESLNILPFNAYIAVKKKNEDLIDKIISRIIFEKPQFHIKGRHFLRKKLITYTKEIDAIFDKELNNLALNDYECVGISYQFYQWIPGNILIEKIKILNSNLKIIIGGFGTKKSAFAYLNNFKNFDFAIWGEGEYPILQLLNKLQSHSNYFEDVPNLIYRENKTLRESNKRNKFSNLDEKLINNYSDYFSYTDKYKLDEIIRIPVETGRGCHWNKCHFCFLNTGYKFRKKSPENVIIEIEHYLLSHNINKFVFLDNDSIGNDLPSFELLLDLIITFRKNNPTFEIFMAEIITKNIEYDVIKKMKLANFRSLQIGYESPSNELLKKIDKKNTFASNLLFIKWSFYFQIKITGLNIIRNLLEEKSEDIYESIDNLIYLRFFLRRNLLEHNHSTLSITSSSRYFKLEGKYNIEEWKISSFLEFLPENYIKDEDKFHLFDFLNLSFNPIWDIFKKVESHYLDSLYEYKLIKNGNLIVYVELLNREKINELHFDTNTSVHWDILCLCNKNVVSIEYLSSYLKTDKIELKSLLEDLNKEGLLYSSKHFEENITVINTKYMYT
ncbi:MAG: radical SAM protein [Candidatus Paceibacterota bacterium]